MKPREYSDIRVIFILQILIGVTLAVLVVFNLNISSTFRNVLLVVTLFSNTLFILLFYKTSITVYENHILFKYGIGAIKVPIEISEIKGCIPLENPRVGSSGLIGKIIKSKNKYFGIKAIEIQFKNRDSVMQLETKYPVEICEEVAFYLADKNK